MQAHLKTQNHEHESKMLEPALSDDAVLLFESIYVEIVRYFDEKGTRQTLKWWKENFGLRFYKKYAAAKNFLKLSPA